jgi:hypothetical protein
MHMHTHDDDDVHDIHTYAPTQQLTRLYRYKEETKQNETKQNKDNEQHHYY